MQGSIARLASETAACASMQARLLAAEAQNKELLATVARLEKERVTLQAGIRTGSKNEHPVRLGQPVCNAGARYLTYGDKVIAGWVIRWQLDMQACAQRRACGTSSEASSSGPGLCLPAGAD